MSTDLYISYFLEEDPAKSNFFSFGFDTPRGVEGITKLLGMFLKELFTARGSDIYDPRAGTVLANVVGGNVTEVDDLSDLITLALDQAGQNIQRYQGNALLPAEERLGTVQLLDVSETVVGDGVQATFKLQNVAGRSLIAELPVT